MKTLYTITILGYAFFALFVYKQEILLERIDTLEREVFTLSVDYRKLKDIVDMNEILKRDSLCHSKGGVVVYFSAFMSPYCLINGESWEFKTSWGEVTLERIIRLNK